MLTKLDILTKMIFKMMKRKLRICFHNGNIKYKVSNDVRWEVNKLEAEDEAYKDSRCSWTCIMS